MAGIYIHIPFCKQACSYCNFHFSTLLKNKKAIVEALLKETSLQAHFFPSETTIASIYFGGGTPSLLDANEINVLLKKINNIFNVSSDAEITLEANPDDLSKTYLQNLKKETSINRLSIGIQSFFDTDLQYMHRAHNGNEAKQCIIDAQEIGFHQLSVDLIYGTPTMNNEQWKQNLQTVFDFSIPHISAYSLTVEDKTSLAHSIKTQKMIAPDEELMVQQFSILLSAMQEHDYTHYEISNFCKVPNFALHNTNYWNAKPYLGLGPSAHSFDGQTRYWNVANNAQYINSIEIGKLLNESENLDIYNQYNEYVLTKIRTMWGIQLPILQERFGKEISSHFLLEINPFIINGWVMAKNETFILTENGKLFCDYITENLFLTNE